MFIDSASKTNTIFPCASQNTSARAKETTLCCFPLYVPCHTDTLWSVYRQPWIWNNKGSAHSPLQTHASVRNLTPADVGRHDIGHQWRLAPGLGCYRWCPLHAHMHYFSDARWCPAFLTVLWASHWCPVSQLWLETFAASVMGSALSGGQYILFAE